MDAHSASDVDQSRLKLNIKFSGRSIPVEIAASSTIKDLKSLLQTLTNVLPRGQKLIFKGKVLSDESTLASLGISDGSKIMLMASQGLHQGVCKEGPIRKEAKVLPGVQGVTKTVKAISVTKSQFERWKATKIIGLSDCGLKLTYGAFLSDIHVPKGGGGGMLDLSVVPLRVLMLFFVGNCKIIPEEVWNCGPSARVIDLSHNSLCEVSAKIACLSSIEKLLLDGNHLSDQSIGWEGVASLSSLTVLSLNQNNLTTLPSSLGALTCLKQLLIASNKLMCLPIEIGCLTQLEVLKAQNNRLKAIPTSLGECVSLVEVDLSCNLLAELPGTFGNLKNLKALYLGNNGLRSLPNTIFNMCSQLSILDLHGTEITMDVLRQFEGWDSFDERRRLKHQKQLDFRVTGSAEFDEGADKNW